MYPTVYLNLSILYGPYKVNLVFHYPSNVIFGTDLPERWPQPMLDVLLEILQFSLIWKTIQLYYRWRKNFDLRRLKI